MKEASGELSMTAVAVVAIAAVGVLFTTLVWPAVKGGILHNAHCSAAYDCSCTGKTCTCTYMENGTTNEITCKSNNYN